MPRIIAVVVGLLTALTSWTTGAGEQGTPAEAQQLLDRAIAHVEAVGVERARADFQRPDGPFIDRDLYVYCVGADARLTSHPISPGLIGMSLLTIKDADGRAFGTQLFLDTWSKGAATVHYRWMHPLTHESTPKVTFSRLVGREICAAGAHIGPNQLDDAEAQVKNLPDLEPFSTTPIDTTASTLADRQLNVGVVESIPLAGVVDDALTGVIGQAADAILTRMGYALSLEVLPPERAYFWLAKGRIDVAINVTPTPAREALAYYSKPIAPDYRGVLVRRDMPMLGKSITELWPLHLGAELGLRMLTDTYDSLIDMRATHIQSALLMADQGRLEGVVLSTISGSYLLKKMALQDDLRFLPHAIELVPLSIGFSRRRFTKRDVARFDQLQVDLTASRTWWDILDHNNAYGLIKHWPLMIAATPPQN